jgi:hypothetical protein
MKLMTQSIRNRAFRRALIAGASVALGVMAAPALADTLGYYYDGPPTVYTAPTTTTTTTYTYTTPTYTYSAPPPAYVYERERRHGIYLETPVLNFGIGVHHDDD